MPTRLADAAIADTIADAQRDARQRRSHDVMVDGVARPVRTPFPSPGDWREVPIYFLMLDRFNNPDAPPRGTWNRRFDFRHGGTFRGVQAQLGTLAALGVGAIWITPVLKNAQPDGRWNYHGYGAQDFLTIDGRFASDGSSATAELELAALVQEAHARGLYVVLDIVLNHAAEVFDYVANTGAQGFTGAVVLDRDIHAAPRPLRLAYSNLGTTGTATPRLVPDARFFVPGQPVGQGPAAALDVVLGPGEVQVFLPE